jgi:glycosyltransferase involved in cell wall biosynthesis
MVSIIVCTYNDSQYLPRALKSCLMQNVEKEVVLVDDCSTRPIVEEAMNLVRKFGVRFIRHPKNSGLSAARNTGIKHSKYDLVIPMDADDYFFPDAVKNLYKEVDDEHGIYYGNLLSMGHVAIPETGLITKARLLDSNPLFSSSLYKKEVWEKVGGYKVREGAHYEDWNFWCRAYIAGIKFKYVPTLVYEHVERSDSMLRKLHNDKEMYVKIATEELQRYAGQ